MSPGRIQILRILILSKMDPGEYEKQKHKELAPSEHKGCLAEHQRVALHRWENSL